MSSQIFCNKVCCYNSGTGPFLKCNPGLWKSKSSPGDDPVQLVQNINEFANKGQYKQYPVLLVMPWFPVICAVETILCFQFEHSLFTRGSFWRASMDIVAVTLANTWHAFKFKAKNSIASEQRAVPAYMHSAQQNRLVPVLAVFGVSFASH